MDEKEGGKTFNFIDLSLFGGEGGGCFRKRDILGARKMCRKYILSNGFESYCSTVMMQLVAECQIYSTYK